MSYYRHYDLDTRIGLMIGEWMYKARNGSTDVGGQPPVEPPHGAGDTRADLIPFPAGSIISADQSFESFEVPPSNFEIVRFLGALAGFCIGGVLFFAFLFAIFFTDLL